MFIGREPAKGHQVLPFFFGLGFFRTSAQAEDRLGTGKAGRKSAAAVEEAPAEVEERDDIEED